MSALCYNRAAARRRLRHGRPSWKLWPSDFTCRAPCRAWVFAFLRNKSLFGYGIAGYAQNLFDGRVEVYAIGSEAQLDALKTEFAARSAHGQRGPGGRKRCENPAEFSHGFTIERDY